MSETVVVVDDSLTVRMDLAEALAKAGYSPLLCATLGEARKAVQAGVSRAFILDVLLPDGDGVELLRELREVTGPVRSIVLMLSTEAEVKDRTRGLRTGADEYIGKPYDSGHVVARLRELLGGGARRKDSPSLQILVIDDSATYRAMLGETLANANYAVRTAATGEEGLQMAAAERPDAMVVDGILPGIDGATVIRRLRLDAALRRIPCLLLTASDERDAELSALDAGADAFVRKSEDPELVLAKLAAMLRRTDARRADEETSSVLGPKKILAVDDSATYLEALATELRREGYDVVLARSGAEAIELLGVQPVDCILLDLVMPGLSGEETCRRVKAAPVVRDIPLVMLTAHDDKETMIQGLGAGADDYIAKSSEFAVLKARVRAQLRRKQFEDENRTIREKLLRKEMEAQEARAARELADTRARLIDELEKKNAELEAFSYSISHDLRAPLRSIDGFSQALLDDCAPQLDEKAVGYLQRVRSSAQRMSELIDDLLELSRTGRAELTRTRVDLGAIARTVAEELERASPDRRLCFAIEGNLAADVDGRLVRVLFENLLGNAEKFSRRREDARIEIGECEKEGERVYFVRDNGVGFDMKHASRLFSPFQRLHTGNEFPGTGIGLAIVGRIVDRHGGRIWAESTPLQGTTFYFTLPASRPPTR